MKNSSMANRNITPCFLTKPSLLVWLAGLLCLAANTWTRSAHAQTTVTHPELRFDSPWIDGLVTGVGFVAWYGTSSSESTFSRSSCRWCNPPGIDTSIRSALRWSDTSAASAISNVTFVQLGIGVIGFNALAAAQAQPDGGFQAWRDFYMDSAAVAEATILAADFNQGVKFLVARERPFVHALAPADKGATSSPADNNTSFYSGHASTSMALAVSMAEVASLRRYDWAPVAWATLPALSLVTGYLRIAADKHYFTDVVSGAAMGALFGYFVPHLFHNPRETGTLNKSEVASLRPMIVTSSNEVLLGAVGSF